MFYLESLKQVAGDPGHVADDEHDHDGQQQHRHGPVSAVAGGSYYPGPGNFFLLRAFLKRKLYIWHVYEIDLCVTG